MMNGSIDKEALASKVITLVKQQHSSLETTELSLTDPLTLQGYDELDCIEIVMRLEEVFELEITDDVADTLTSVQNIIDFIFSSVK